MPEAYLGENPSIDDLKEQLVALKKAKANKCLELLKK